MTTNDHESVARVARYAAHITALAAAFKVHLAVCATMRPDEAGAGINKADKDLPRERQRLMIKIYPVIDDTTYAVALHELGHCAHAVGSLIMESSIKMRLTNRVSTLRDVRLQLDGENAAWEWAHHYALEWTASMTAIETFSRESYLLRARQLGVK